MPMPIYASLDYVYVEQIDTGKMVMKEVQLVYRLQLAMGQAVAANLLCDNPTSCGLQSPDTSLHA